MLCRDVMTPNPTTCAMECNARAAASVMAEDDVGIVPVIDSKTRQVIGVVTDRDLCLKVVAEGKHPEYVKISEVMSGNPVICRPDDDIHQCLEQMKRHWVRRIPVVDESGHCVGIISQRDIVLNLTDAQEVYETVREICRPGRVRAA